jgi:hypothetical protein
MVHSGVYRLAGIPEYQDQMYLAAVLYGGTDALLGGEPAGFKWGLSTCRALKPHIITTRNVRDPQIRIVRRARPPAPVDYSRVDSIPLTSPTRTLIDLASLVSPARLQHALDSALRKRLTTPDRILQRMDSIPRRGWKGIATLQTFVDEAILKPTPHSWLERKFLALLHLAGFSEPVRQFAVDIGWERPIHIDFAFPDFLIGIETDGYEPHASRKQWELDRRRDAALVLRGWLILRFSYDDIVNRPDYVLATLREAMDRRRAS